MSETQPQSPLGWAAPAQSELLIHFCGRPEGRQNTSDVPQEIVDMAPEERLDAILREERIPGFPPLGSPRPQPMVCFSESPTDDLRHLLGERRWRPWGLVLSRAFVYSRDGGPVWYARPRQFAQARLDQLPWMVRFGTDVNGFLDRTREREWRIPGDALDVDADDVFALLVGDPGWEPSTVEYPVVGGYFNGVTGEPFDPQYVDAVQDTSTYQDSPMMA